MNRNKEISFGTDGIRGEACQFPFTSDGLAIIGRSIAEWGRQKYGTGARILIGHDTRSSCTFIKQELTQALLKHGMNVGDGGVLPTPALFSLVKNADNYQCALVISASHNAYHDNGIKLFDCTHGKLQPEDEQILCAAFERNMTETEQKFTQPGQSTAFHDASEIYCQSIISQFKPALLTGLRVVLDCAHGATYNVAPTVFKALGADVITINAEPNGTNINHACGAVYPERLKNTMRSTNADIGFAFDGDGDRVIGVNQEGRILDGDDLLCILLQHPLYKHAETLVGTVMTNLGLEHHLHENEKKLVRVKVGDKYIAAELEKNNLILGGETSGHVILRDYLPTGDGLFVAARVVESLLLLNNLNSPTFTKCPQVLINVRVDTKKDLQLLPFAQLITDHEEQLLNGRMVVRYSGTENVLRVMAEDKTYDSANTVASTLALKLKKALQ